MPYGYDRAAVKTRISTPLVDGEVADGVLNENWLAVELDKYGGWERVEMELTFEVDEERIRALVPEEETDSPPVALVVALRAPDSFTRRTVCRRELDVGGGEGTRVSESMELRRSEVRGEVTVKPLVVRTQTHEYRAPGKARRAGSRIGGGREVSIVVDRGRTLADQYLEIDYTRFSERDDLGDAKAAISHLKHQGESPVLWINQDHPGVQEVMDSEAPTGATARLRDVFFDAVTPGVWKQLFFAAVDGLDREGETTYAWQDAVLNRFLEGLYPGEDKLARREHVLEEVTSASGIARLLQDLDRIVQSDNEFGQHFTKAAREVGGE